ncbi:unnamed protein product, partial [Arabidopsis halleri]
RSLFDRYCSILIKLVLCVPRPCLETLNSMGTPEFPDLGKHCSVDVCKQIDFMPFTCDRCLQVLCLDHRSYMKHDCPRDVTVVNTGVWLNPEEDSNANWDKHVNNTDCDPSKKKPCPVPENIIASFIAYVVEIMVNC